MSDVSETREVRLLVNGCEVVRNVAVRRLLADFLREDLGLTATRLACEHGVCGACTVIVDGKPVFSCLVPVSAVGSRPVRTVEGLGTPQKPSVLQKAFIDSQAAQCGYCIAGMIMRAQALLDVRPGATEAEIREHMQPNLCRCGTHMRIVAAIVAASKSLHSGPQARTAATPHAIAAGQGDQA